MRKIKFLLLLLSLLCTAFTVNALANPSYEDTNSAIGLNNETNNNSYSNNIASHTMNAYLSPFGGFSEENNSRTIIIDRKEYPATLKSAALKFFSKARKGSKIRIGMYSFSSRGIKDAIVKAARAGAHIRIIMDGCERTAEKTLADLKNTFSPYSNIELAAVTPEAMYKMGRSSSVADPDKPGSKPSMHEKFGVHWYKENGSYFVDSFTGSSNFSDGSNTRYSENRILNENDLLSGYRAWQEFISLWNSDFNGKCYTGNCEYENKDPEVFDSLRPYTSSDVYNLIDSYSDCAKKCSEIRSFNVCISNCDIPRRLKQLSSYPTVSIFNSSYENGRFISIRTALLKSLNTVNTNNGIIRIGAFKFGSSQIADGIIEFAKENPDVQIRIILDQTEFNNRNARKLDAIKNITVKIKWRNNGFGWDGNSSRLTVTHSNDFKYHHKMFLMGDSFLANGSYNFTNKAETKNLENETFYANFSGDKEEVQKVIDAFKRDFDALWFDETHTFKGTNVKDGLLFPYKKASYTGYKIQKYFDNGISNYIKRLSKNEKKTFREKYGSEAPYDMLPQLHVRDLIMSKPGISLREITNSVNESSRKIKTIVRELRNMKIIFKENNRFYITD